MPTSTFFRLPEEKRRRLLRCAMAEFAARPYGETPLSGIIQAAGIPRGSFYQYFADKTDLFQYVLRQLGSQMDALLVESLESCGGDLFQLPLVLFDRAAAYLREDAEDARVALGILRRNAGVGMGRLWPPQDSIRRLLERADLAGLPAAGQEELYALLDLLLAGAGQALLAACRGAAEPDRCRAHLERKVAIIRRGVIKQEMKQEERLC